MDTHELPVVDPDKCTACGDCVDICPRDLFSLHPVSHQLWVACKSLEKGEDAEAECEVLCTACGRCAQDAPDGLIIIENNLAVIDYTKNKLASPLAIERCPTGAIVWLKDKTEAIKGKEAKKIIRNNPLPIG
jgi:ferredoxin